MDCLLACRFTFLLNILNSFNDGHNGAMTLANIFNTLRILFTAREAS